MLRFQFRHAPTGALLAVALLCSGARAELLAQAVEAAAAGPPAGTLPANAMRVPFFVGEKLTYDVKFGAIKVGTGTMEVLDLADVRGKTSWHTILRVSGSIPFYKVRDRYESWFDVVSLTSRRYFQDIEEGGYKPKRHYELFPERGMYRLKDEPEQPTVSDPLDEGSFLYFIRTIPLDVGQTYSFSRYFKPEGNPVSITVSRRETITTPAGKFDCVVIKPTFRSKGLFSEDGQAEIWITDDAARVMVQLKTKLTIGSLNLFLSSHNARVSP